MSSGDQNKPGKSGRRNRKAGQQRSSKPDQSSDARHDQPPAADEPIAAAAAPADTSPVGAVASTDTAPVDAVASADTSTVGAAAPADPPPVGFQTIATAYRDYTRKSLEEARCFVEKLSGVRSLDKALEVQSEFARQAYQTFAADSQKIRELYGELARQAFKPSKPPPTAR